MRGSKLRNVTRFHGTNKNIVTTARGRRCPLIPSGWNPRGESMIRGHVRMRRTAEGFAWPAWWELAGQYSGFFSCRSGIAMNMLSTPWRNELRSSCFSTIGAAALCEVANPPRARFCRRRTWRSRRTYATSVSTAGPGKDVSRQSTAGRTRRTPAHGVADGLAFYRDEYGRRGDAATAGITARTLCVTPTARAGGVTAAGFST